MIRSVSSSLLSALLTATLFCGGCVACPQFFMFPGVKKDCCKAGKCDRTTSQKTTTAAKACKRMPIEAHGFSPLLVDLAASSVPAQPFLPPVLRGCNAVLNVMPVEHSPPDLQVLNATFLI